MNGTRIKYESLTHSERALARIGELLEPKARNTGRMAFDRAVEYARSLNEITRGSAACEALSNHLFQTEPLTSDASAVVRGVVEDVLVELAGDKHVADADWPVEAFNRLTGLRDQLPNLLALVVIAEAVRRTAIQEVTPASISAPNEAIQSEGPRARRHALHDGNESHQRVDSESPDTQSSRPERAVSKAARDGSVGRGRGAR